MIYDCFLFNNEYDLLKIRCEEFSGLGVVHIIVESIFTFTGQIKHIDYRSGWWMDFKDKYNIEWVMVGYQMPNNGNPWDNEKFQRNHISEALKQLKPNDDDIILISDVDEIPRAEAIKNYKPEDGLKALIMDKFGYYLNCKEGIQSWHMAKIMPYGYLKNTTPDEVRNGGFPAKIENAGWHWSYLGGVETIMNKMDSFSHQEESVQKLNNEVILSKKLENCQSLWGEDFWSVIPIDESFPHYVQWHQRDSLKHLIKQV